MNEVNLSKVLIRDTVLLDVEPFTDKETMFETLAAKFEAAGIVTDAKQYIKALEERETLGSTYMGNMIALPHGKCDAVVKPGIGFCRCKQTFRYCSHDEEGDVRYVFMLAIAANQSSDQYLRVLATLAGLLTNLSKYWSMHKAMKKSFRLSIPCNRIVRKEHNGNGKEGEFYENCCNYILCNRHRSYVYGRRGY